MSSRGIKRARGGSTASKEGVRRKEYGTSTALDIGSSSTSHPTGMLAEASLTTTQKPVQLGVSPGLPPPGKMLLPPLPKSRALHASSKIEKNRTSRACDKCRKSKAKCSGEQSCSRCRQEGRECIYGDGKRDKEKKEMQRLLNQNQRIRRKSEQLVTSVLNFASELDYIKRRELEELIMSRNSVTDKEDDLLSNFDSEPIESDSGDLLQGEENADAEVGSLGSLDVIHEDTNRDENTRAAGFMGKSSAVSWVQRAKRAALYDLEDEGGICRSATAAANGSFTDSTYHAEPADILAVHTNDVNPLEWPPLTVAKALADAYFSHVHPSFSILCEQDFNTRSDSFPKDQLSIEDQSWLTVANMVFAIGAKFAHLTQADFRGDERDHLIYYARARALGMDERTLNQNPEVQHTSCLGVLGVYLLATDQLNKSWTVCGIALRNAMALGLHVRSEAKDLSDKDKEFRVRLWWSLYGLESLLDELTGRPSCISDRDISTPLPINVDESQFGEAQNIYGRPLHNTINLATKGKPKALQNPTPAVSSTSKDLSLASSQNSSDLISVQFHMTRLPYTPSTLFVYRTQLSIISHEILTKLYSASLVKAKWSKVQDTIRQIDARLLRWKASLPEEFDFSYRPPNHNVKFTHDRTSLSMFYNSSRMKLFRPCLCRFEGRIENESDRSKVFDTNSAITCVISARNILASLPSLSEPTQVYTITSWWNAVHYIIEAASALMLELAYKAEHMPTQAAEILADSKKAVMWLRAMSDQSIAARKGWEIFDNLLQQVAPKVGGDLWDMPDSAPVPPGWKWNRFGRRSRRGSGRDDHMSDVGVQGQSLPAAHPDSMNVWVDQSMIDLQQGFSTPAPPIIGTYAAENGIMPSLLVGLYPFNEIYGRYEPFGNLQNLYPPEAGAVYQSVTGEGGMSELEAVAPQTVAMGPVQLGEDVGRYDLAGVEEGQYNVHAHPR